jgi:hypothetical protein
MNQRTHEAIFAGVLAAHERSLTGLLQKIEDLRQQTDTADINFKVYVDTIGYTVIMMDANGTITDDFTRDMGCDLFDEHTRMQLIEGLRAALTLEAARFLKDFDRKERGK